ncbi:MAG: ATP-binding protein [Acidobacteriota bacterium]
MNELPDLDKQISSIREWIVKAGSALQAFYHPSVGTFWRDSLGLKAADPDIHPTATNRSFYALYEYLRFLVEGDYPATLQNEVRLILKGVSEKYLGLLLTEPEEVRRSKVNEINMFTDGHLLVSVALLPGLAKSVKLDLDLPAIKIQADLIANESGTKLLDWVGGKVTAKDDVHDFITLYAVRGLDAHFGLNVDQAYDFTQALRDRVKDTVLRLLAFNFANVSSRFDPAELAFSLAVLDRFPTPDAPQLRGRSLQSIVANQAEDGAWPTARIISYEGYGLLHVASYEVALAITHILHRSLRSQDFQVCDYVLKALRSSFELVKSHYNSINGVSGWANDHTRRMGLVESWATAIVLTFLISYQDALRYYRQSLILKKYGTWQPPNGKHSLAWPDMIPGFRHNDVNHMDLIDSISDPTPEATLTKAVRKELLEPIDEDWVHRPKKASLILYGPPGTRKTSLAREMARAIDWPLLTLSPPDFLQKGGLEGFEASAAEIFDDLLRLRRVVVFFDESEDFFKKRPDLQQLESRTLGAFITSGMLPRLQRLREKRWAIFLLSTNSELNELDDAVIRRGRFDFAQRLFHPALQAQVRYIRGKAMKLPTVTISVIESALSHQETVAKTEQDGDAAMVSFTILDDLLALIVQRPNCTEEEAREALSELVRRKDPPPLAHLS